MAPDRPGNEGAAAQPLWRVVVNDEEQFSLWPLARELPEGWRDEGTHGTREQCLARVERVWTDQRPRSVRDPGGGAPR